MSTTWSPDTCDCKIEYNKDIQWIRSINNCRLHQGLRGQNHLDLVLGQNRRFNNSLGEFPNELERKLIGLSKEVNKRKIRGGDMSEDLPDRPEELSVSFWENIRNRLPF